jgi:hypothetical protein
MKKISSIIKDRLILQAEEAKELGFDKLAERIIESVDVDSSNESYMELKENICKNIWKSATLMLDYYNVNEFDASQLNKVIANITNNAIDELEISLNTDSRFAKQNNGSYGATLDLRVITDGGFATMIRIDKKGVSILTPSFLQIHASQGIKLSSDSDISIEAETLYLQNRMVLKEFGGSI